LKLNVLHIIDSLNAGGAETVAINTVNALNSRRNVNAYLCATREEGPLKEQIEKISRYIFLNKKSTLDFKAIGTLKDFILNNKIGIIHAHSTSFFLAYLLTMRLSKVKVIWHNHSGANINSKGKKLWILKRCVKSFSAVINVNDSLNDWSKNQLKFTNSFRLNNFAAPNRQDQITDLKGQSTTKIVCVAGFRKEKDHLTLLKAFKELLRHHAHSSLHLIGKDYNDDYSNSIKSFIKDEGLFDKVFLYGNIKDVFNVLKQASIGVLSSKSEGLPLSLLEYGLAELPVVVTNVGDCVKIVEQNKSGLLVERENEIELANAIKKFLDDPEEAKKNGRRLKVNVEQNYSKEKYIEDLISIYKSL
jgi:glycosyltransferase involved in cell wall biosynthesis